jgi:alkanesulfonate monooxygenase SsuD/methylene tetrahydromethanopterin reductase-like flavin-dependent oxidoreductase (luciferase family)
VHVGVTDRDRYAEAARRDLFSYAVVDAYAANFSRAGYEDSVAEVRAHHDARERDAAVAAVSDAWVDGVQIMGDEKHVQRAVQEYVDAGVEKPIVFPLPWGEDRTAVVEHTLSAALPEK